MAQIPDDTPQPDGPVTQQVNPVLQKFVDNFQTDAGGDVGAELAARVQRHLDTQNAAMAAQAAHSEFINNLASTKDSLVGLARQDPHSADLAMDLADITMRGLTQHLGHEEGNDAHQAILGHMQGEIAHAAIQGLAGIDEGAARRALSNGRLSDALPDEAKPDLDQYITNMANFRAMDASARQAEMVRQHIRSSNDTAKQWLSGMTNPQTGELWFPDNWGQRMLADGRMSPQDKAGLHLAYQNLIANGNPTASDPGLVMSLLGRASAEPHDPTHPTVGEVVGHAGRGLTMSDAQFIAGQLGPRDQSARAGLSSLVSALDDARGQIGNDRAFGRYIQAVLPAARQGSLVLDPADKAYMANPERMANFMPTGDDLIANAVRADAERRPSLGEIFSNPRGFSMRSEPVAGYRQQQGESIPTKLYKGVTGLPGAIAHGAKTGWDVATKSPEELDKQAYDNPLPVKAP